MNFKITEISEPESRIYINFHDEKEKYHNQIVLAGEELEAFSTGNRAHFLDHIESMKQDYSDVFHELSEYVASLSEPGTCSEHDADEVREFVGELEGITDKIKHNQVALAAMDGKFGA